MFFECLLKQLIPLNSQTFKIKDKSMRRKFKITSKIKMNFGSKFSKFISKISKTFFLKKNYQELSKKNPNLSKKNIKLC